MGAYESIQRNQNNIGSIADLIAGIRTKNRRNKQRQGLISGLTEQVQEETPEYKLAASAIDSINPMEITAEPPMNRLSDPSARTRPSIVEPVPQRYRTAIRLRAPGAADAPWISELMDMDAGQVLDFMMGAEERDARKQAAALTQKRNRLFNVPEGTDLIDVETGKPVHRNVKDFRGVASVAPPKKIDSYVREDGVRVNVFQNPDGSTYEQEFGKTRPPGSGAPPVDQERERILKVIDAKTKEAYEVGAEMSKFDSQMLTDPGARNKDGEWESPEIEAQYRQRKAAYEGRLKALRRELERLNRLIGGEFGADESGGASGEGEEFGIDDVRAAYPNLKDLSDQEVIDAYKAQGVTVRPK